MATSPFTNTRALSASRDTGIAQLPGVPRPTAGDPALQSWMNKVQEHLEVRAGARGNDAERVVTQRELQAVASGVQQLTTPPETLMPGQAQLSLGGGLTATVAIEQFTNLIKNTQLYRDLIKRLDDPSRFDNLPEAVRQSLLTSVADEARKLGAQVTRVEQITQDRFTSLAMQINTVTASVDANAAGVRQLEFASAEQDRAQAGKITQLEASLGNFYQDGTPGRVLLEEQMTVTADRIEGLSGQYTLKIQAGGSLAGFGLAATEVDGVPDSAFIIAANKFAIVDPLTWTTGLTNTPDDAHIPFGVDGNGIYMNSNVYVRGLMRVDTAGKTLIDGLRGSLDLNAGTGAWSDTAARQAVWTALGKSGSPSNNNHLVIGDMVTMGTGASTVTKQWMGSSWDVPGVVINGSLLVNGSVAAVKIDTNGLVIRDAAGNPILGAGVSLPVSYILGLGGLATQNTVSNTQVTGLGDLATQNTVSNTQVTGLGTMSTQNYASIGSTVRFPDGTVMGTTDFVSRLQKIDGSNIGVFMATAAIGTAYIGNAAVGTLQIGGNAVIVPQAVTGGDVNIAANGTALIFDAYIDMGPQLNGQNVAALMGVFSFFMRSTDDSFGEAGVYINGQEPAYLVRSFGLRVSGGGDTDMSMPVTVSFVVPNLSGTTRVSCRVTSRPNGAGDYHPFGVMAPALMMFGGKR
jgi:hypothetical protein